MRVVVADTTPLRYLAEIDLLFVLPRLFTTIHIPVSVYAELQQTATPPLVRHQFTTPPSWLIITPDAPLGDTGLNSLDAGERAAITLSMSIHADLILIDERKGTLAAMQRGFQTTGTLGILLSAAQRGLIDLEDAFTRLKATTFRYTQAMLTQLLNKHRKR